MAVTINGICALLQVFDMPASVSFYRDALGFEAMMTSHPGDDFDWALLRHGSAELMLNTQYECGQRPVASAASRQGPAQ